MRNKGLAINRDKTPVGKSSQIEGQKVSHMQKEQKFSRCDHSLNMNKGWVKEQENVNEEKKAWTIIWLQPSAK